MIPLDINPFNYYLIIYTAYITLPLFPALIIYLVAPGTPIKAEGTLNKVTFKASGAFAAYIITVLLGFFIIESAKEQIAILIEKASCDITWKVKANIKFQDIDTGKEVEPDKAQDFLKTLQVYIKPKLSDFTSNHLCASIPQSFIKDNDATLLFSVDQSLVSVLNDPIVLNDSKPENVDSIKKIINLHEVTLQIRRRATPSLDSFASFAVPTRVAIAPPPAPPKKKHK